MPTKPQTIAEFAVGRCRMLVPPTSQQDARRGNKACGEGAGAVATQTVAASETTERRAADFDSEAIAGTAVA